jgi:type II secretory pathway pseudopilin PulG
MMVVVSLIVVTSAVAVIRMTQTITLLDADKAANLVSDKLRFARQIALDDRRNVLVEFISPNEIKVTRQDSPTPTVMYDGTLPSGYHFGLPTGIGDTPDAYGNTAPVSFNTQTSGLFRGDGIFTDAGGIVMSGTVFTINSGNNTSRAVTLVGASGRLRTYSIAGTTWVAR